jgi:formyltetrahydrofolate deformylase
MALILTLQCPDRVGIVAAVTHCVAQFNGNITQSAQFGDPATGTHFMRVAFTPPDDSSLEDFRKSFEPVASQFTMDWNVWDDTQPQRILILVSKLDHCLLDLLYRRHLGSLPLQNVTIASNHEAARIHAERNDLPFHYLPVTKTTKLEQETGILRIVCEEKIDLVILARYMQVLSDGLSAKLAGRCINIHHSFLPSFKGAAPYSQAHARGVKIIGATAHFVTADLDEGPIIEQETERVDHAMDVDNFISIGREIEARVLARAVKYHLEHRVLINGRKTVVFR